MTDDNCQSLGFEIERSGEPQTDGLISLDPRVIGEIGSDYERFNLGRLDCILCVRDAERRRKEHASKERSYYSSGSHFRPTDRGYASPGSPGRVSST